MQIKIVGEVDQLLNLFLQQARRKVFEDNELDTVWEELNTRADHRPKVIEWREAKIIEEIAKDFQGVAKRSKAWRVQERYRTSKSVAMNRCIKKRESPLCPIEEEKICKHYRETWTDRSKSSSKQSKTRHSI
jgi:hypothetical protein